MDGSLLFVGRKDNQIKLRGQRIELGEIESQILHAMPGLKDIVVELVTAENKPPAPFAFLWSGQDDNTNSSNDGLFHQPKTIQASLVAQLPAYMIPSGYFPLRYIPRSNTGKIDRKSLREAAAIISPKETISFCQETSHEARREPRTDAEKIVQQAVATVLRHHTADIGLESDFFQLGGTSLTAMRLVSTLRKLGDNSLRTTDIYNRPVLWQLAERVTTK